MTEKVGGYINTVMAACFAHFVLFGVTGALCINLIGDHVRPFFQFLVLWPYTHWYFFALYALAIFIFTICYSAAIENNLNAQSFLVKNFYDANFMGKNLVTGGNYTIPYSRCQLFWGLLIQPFKFFLAIVWLLVTCVMSVFCLASGFVPEFNPLYFSKTLVVHPRQSGLGKKYFNFWKFIFFLSLVILLISAFHLQIIMPILAGFLALFSYVLTWIILLIAVLPAVCFMTRNTKFYKELKLQIKSFIDHTCIKYRIYNQPQ